VAVWNAFRPDADQPLWIAVQVYETNPKRITMVTATLTTSENRSFAK
jgi:hypothetical protein